MSKAVGILLAIVSTAAMAADPTELVHQAALGWTQGWEAVRTEAVSSPRSACQANQPPTASDATTRTVTTAVRRPCRR